MVAYDENGDPFDDDVLPGGYQAAPAPHDIWEAIRSHNTAVAKAFLEQGFPPDTRNRDGNTALVLAAVYNQVEVARLLVEHGADVNVTGVIGRTPLIIAAVNRRFEMLKFLLENGADIKIEDDEGRTAVTVLGPHNEDVLEFMRTEVERRAMEDEGRIRHAVQAQQEKIHARARQHYKFHLT